MKPLLDKIRIALVKMLAGRDLQVVMNVGIFGRVYVESDRSGVFDYRIYQERDDELEQQLLREAREIINNG